MSLIPKLKIETTYNELQAVVETVNSISNIAMPLRAERLSKSIIMPLFKKLQKKEVDKRFDHKKPFNISMQYYEAYYLEEFLQLINSLEYNHFLQMYINKLNQKLA